ncbi:alpha/beta hydrolase [Saccharothrix xinjiangensis]|uniref:Alpha/beta fold hydrolase n=1 Tax=Saccharothrix xinjiangensis TaxID=204798 RepID=A0ABV9YBJ9_9PSEU
MPEHSRPDRSHRSHRLHRLHLDNRTLAYADHGGPGTPLLALHGTFGRGAVFDRLAADLGDLARVIAPDQRGHGRSDRAASYTREDFVDDAARLLHHLDLGPVVVLGHSLGGTTAHQLAARRPDLVEALVIEDIGPVTRRPEVPHPVLDVRGWPDRAPTRSALKAAIEAQGVPDAGYFALSAVEAGDHWRLLFDWDDMVEVQRHGAGDWWPDWLASTCPALLLRGEHSPLLPADLARRAATRRPNTHLVEVPGAGHWIHDDAPTELAEAVAEFLRALQRTRR